MMAEKGAQTALASPTRDGQAFNTLFAAILGTMLIVWITVLSPSPASPLSGLDSPDSPDSEAVSERLSVEPRSAFEQSTGAATAATLNVADQNGTPDEDTDGRDTVLITPMDPQQAEDLAARPTATEILSGAGILLLSSLAGALWISQKGAAPHRKTLHDVRANAG